MFVRRFHAQLPGFLFKPECSRAAANFAGISLDTFGDSMSGKAHVRGKLQVGPERDSSAAPASRRATRFVGRSAPP